MIVSTHVSLPQQYRYLSGVGMKYMVELLLKHRDCFKEEKGGDQCKLIHPHSIYHVSLNMSRSLPRVVDGVDVETRLLVETPMLVRNLYNTFHFISSFTILLYYYFFM